MLSLHPFEQYTIANNGILADVTKLRNAKWAIDGDYFFLPQDDPPVDGSQPATDDDDAAPPTNNNNNNNNPILNHHHHHHNTHRFAWNLYGIHDPNLAANADKKVRLKLCGRCGEAHKITASHHTRHTGGAGTSPSGSSRADAAANNNTRNAAADPDPVCDAYHLVRFNITGSWAPTVYRMNLTRNQPMEAIFVAFQQNLVVTHFQSSRPTVSFMRVFDQERRRGAARAGVGPGANITSSDDEEDDDSDSDSETDQGIIVVHPTALSAGDPTATTMTPIAAPTTTISTERAARWCFSREVKTAAGAFESMPGPEEVFSLYNADEERVVFVQPKTKQYHVYDVDKSEWETRRLAGRGCPEFPKTVIAACWVSGRWEKGAEGGGAGGRESGFCLIGTDDDAWREEEEEMEEGENVSGKGKGKDVTTADEALAENKKRKAGEMADGSDAGALSSSTSNMKTTATATNITITKRRRREISGTVKLYWFRPERPESYGPELELDAEFSIGRFPYLRRTNYSAFATGDLVVFYERGNSTVTAYHVETREWVEIRLSTEVPDIAILNSTTTTTTIPPSFPADAELVDLFQHDGQPYAIMALCIHPRTNTLRYLSYSFRPLSRQPKFSTEIGSILSLSLDPLTAASSFADFSVIPDHSFERDRRPIFCHAAILHARWPHFRTMIGAEMCEFRQRVVKMPETRATVIAFLTYLYSNVISVNLVSDPETFKSLWKLGNLYLLYDLVAKCRQSLEEVELGPGNLAEVYRLAVWAPGEDEGGEAQEGDERPRGEQAVRVKRKVFDYLADEGNLKECLADPRFRELEKELVFEIWANASRG